MKPGDPIKLVSQLIDLPLVDKDERWCGVVDDIEFTGGPGKEAKVKALLAGPGAYQGRLPRWAFWLVRKVAGDRVARIPLDKVDTIGTAVKLKCAAEDVKLHVIEDKVRGWIPRRGAL
jgi:hypothetical protein